MIEQLSQTQLFLLVFLLLCCAVVGILLHVSRVRKAEESVLAQFKEIQESLERDQIKLNKQFTELRSIFSGLSKKTNAHQEAFDQVLERIVALENIDADGRYYTRANKMVQMGADVNELIEECELPKAEAELMISLQSKLQDRS